MPGPAHPNNAHAVRRKSALAMLCVAAALACALAGCAEAEVDASDGGDEAQAAVLTTQGAFAEASDVGAPAASAQADSDEVADIAADPYDFHGEDFAEVPGGAGIAGFSLDAARSAPDVGEADTLAQAVAAVTESGVCSAVFVNLETGLGIAVDADDAVYSASTFKAVYADYVLRRFGSLDEVPSYVSNWIESAITASDNDSYDALHAEFDGEEFYLWLESLGLDRSLADDTYYPHVSARQMALLWENAYELMAEGGDAGAWYAGLLANTSVSYIRNGLEGTGAAVWNKAGWIANGWIGTGERLNSVSDAGIVEADGTRYLMVIMTGQPDDEADEERVAAVARALFDMRGILA